MKNVITVGKLKELLKVVPDESGIWLYVEMDDGNEERDVHEVSICYEIEDGYNIPYILFKSEL